MTPAERYVSAFMHKSRVRLVHFKLNIICNIIIMLYKITGNR